jgi:hypothetical protein
MKWSRGPLVSLTRHSTAHASRYCVRARHRARCLDSHCTPPVTTAPHVVVLPCSRVASKGTRLPFPSPSCHPATALLCSPPRWLCSPWPATTKPLPSPSKLGKRLAIVAYSSSIELEFELLAIDAGRASSPCHLLLPRGSPSTTTI